MLLKKEKTAQIDPLENWPEHYYEIENAKERKEILAQAISWSWIFQMIITV